MEPSQRQAGNSAKPVKGAGLRHAEAKRVQHAKAAAQPIQPDAQPADAKAGTAAAHAAARIRTIIPLAGPGIARRRIWSPFERGKAQITYQYIQAQIK